MNASLLIDDFGPLTVQQPGSVGELQERVRQAKREQQAIYPMGGQTMLDLGLPPSKAGLAIDLRRLEALIDYPARDMTITVQAGMTLEKLQGLLAQENQWLPVDVPNPHLATLGGAIATNTSGARRFGHGTLRDYVIGISVINDQGEEIHAGGRVVKNVAGYDLMKLYTGSLGTLGIISQVTLKVKPKPESSRLILTSCKRAELPELLQRMATSQTRPVTVDLLNALAISPFPAELGWDWQIILGYEDNAAAVTWQLQQIQQELHRPIKECRSDEIETLWSALRDFPLLPTPKLSFKANVLTSQLIPFLTSVEALSPQPLLQVHAGNGIVQGHFVGDFTLERMQPVLAQLLELATQAKGNLILTRCPTSWKTTVPIWGKATGDRELMKTIKQSLDPDRIFNPGRFVDGI